MERPFAEKRPIGPLAQSDRFSEQLLASGHSNERVEEGNVLMVEILGHDLRDAMSFANDAAVAIEEFVVLQQTGRATGEREQIKGRGEVGVAIQYYDVERVRDEEVTIGQINQFMEQELQGSLANVFQVNVHPV